MGRYIGSENEGRKVFLLWLSRLPGQGRPVRQERLQDLQILPIKVLQKLQEEEEPSQGKVDQGVPQRKRNVPVKYDRELWKTTIGAMMRVEAIKEKRQAQFILDRQKKAKLIEREKDAREVKRDMALIRSPAAGMKRVAREMEVDENEAEEEKMASDGGDLDTSIALASSGKKAKKKSKPRARVVVEEEEEDHEMRTEEPELVEA